MYLKNPLIREEGTPSGRGVRKR